MRKAEQRLREEARRVDHYLDASTEAKIKAVVERELISNHMHELVEMERSGIVPMLRDDKSDDLACMYNLFGRVEGGHALMRERMGEYIRRTGRDLVEDEGKRKKPKEFVNGLLALKV